MTVGFIYNPESGSGKIISYLSWIKEEFLKHNHEITFFQTEKENDAYYFALEASSYDMILVAGGDGTLNEVVNGVMQFEEKPIISYIPTGTVNDVGHLIGMKKNVKKSVKMILENPVIKPIDICKINEKFFVYVAAAGKFTRSSYDISRKSKKRFGKYAYYLRGAKEIFKDYKIPLKITTSEEVLEETSSLIIILNGRRVGGLRLYGLKNKLDDGKLSLRTFKKDSWFLLKVILFFLTGGLYDTTKNHTIRDSHFKIETEEDVSWNIDGEYMGSGSIEVNVVPKAVRFIVNKKKIKKNFVK